MLTPGGAHDSWLSARGARPSWVCDTMPMALRAELLEHRTHMTEANQRKNSARLLLLGALCGFLGFAFAMLIGSIKAYTFIPFSDENYCATYNFTKLNPCYFPATVSEMVHTPTDPTGKVFFCFEFVGALLIFFSWYPTQLRNAYIGDDAKVPGLGGIAWVTFRQYVPAPGMMLLAAVTEVPIAQANILDYFCILLHLTGATFMFIGYFCAEAATVGWGPFNAVSEEKRHFAPNGAFYRRLCLHGIAISYLVFCVLQVVLNVGTGDGFDEWEFSDAVRAHGLHKPQLVKAAGGPVRFLKLLSYGSEVICGMFLLGSHFIIWFNCEERHYDLPEELLHLPLQAKPLSPDLEKFLKPQNVELTTWPAPISALATSSKTA